MRRAIGATVAFAGALTVGYAGVGYARAAAARDAARTRWETMAAREALRTIDERLDGAAAPPVYTPGAPVGELRIPSIGLDEVIVEGVGEPELAAGPGHLPGSALPGETGNAVISAHRDRHFHGLARVAVGDTITTRTEAGSTTWRVSEIRVLRKEAPALASSRSPTLTLTTCWPVSYFGPAPERLIVTARPLDADIDHVTPSKEGHRV